MQTLSKIIARLLLLVLLLSPAVQVHADHDSGGSSTQSLLSFALTADSDVHDEATPHQDTTATGVGGCTDHPVEMQAITSCHSGAQTSVQGVATLVIRMLSAQIGVDSDVSSYADIRELASSHKPPLLFLRI